MIGTLHFKLSDIPWSENAGRLFDDRFEKLQFFVIVAMNSGWTTRLLSKGFRDDYTEWFAEG